MATARHKPVTVRPADVAVDEGVPRSPDIQPNYPFTLVHYHGWDFDEATGEWLPRLSEVRHAPGCNGVVWVGTAANGRANPAGAINGATSKGGVVITPGDRRLGEFQHYLAGHKIKGGGTFYCLRSVEIAILDGGRRSMLSPDKDWYRAFKRHLYESGIVPRMARETLDTKVATLDARLATYRQQFNAGKVTLDAFKARQAEIEALVARYVEAYAAVAESLPGDEAPAGEEAAAPVARAAAMPVPADSEVEAAAAAARARPATPRVRVGKPAAPPAGEGG